MKALQFVVLYISKAGIIMDSCTKLETAISMRDSLPVEAKAKVVTHCPKHGIQVCEEEGCVECESDHIDALYEEHVDHRTRMYAEVEYAY
jgi:hypothetical protein